jgi:hypothetical protein
MRAGRRPNLFRQETGWGETEYAGVSVISMTFADKKTNLLTTKICI